MALSNALNPNVDRISFRHGTAVILAGIATTHQAIYLDVGGTATLGCGSIYLSSGGTQTTDVVWVLLPAKWTPLTIS